MGKHSITDAEKDLSRLISEAQSGEAVVIMRDGRPVAELRALDAEPRIMTAADIDWLAARRIRPASGMPKEDAATLVSRMRDEDWL